MKTKFIIAVIFIASISYNAISQTVNIASGQTITKKSANADENSKAIPVSIGVDYFKPKWFYLTTNFSYQKRDYISD
ncbi:MAG: hypothetical protein ACLFUC_07540 [Bacteroidales bacterium]